MPEASPRCSECGCPVDRAEGYRCAACYHEHPPDPDWFGELVCKWLVIEALGWAVVLVMFLVLS